MNVLKSFGLAALTVVAAVPGSRASESLIDRGAYLARAGDCAGCHSEPHSPPLSGGVAIASPFGKIYAPNITPDKRTGIGDWSEEEFYRAMHEGIGRRGEYLYPAFPYLWFTKITRDDVRAIKAYLDSLPPVHKESRKTHLIFPFNLRSGMAAWNAAFFKAGAFKPDPSRPAQVNRGAYLVEGLGHCGDCHTPKGFSFEPLRDKAFAGGGFDDWYAPDITADVKLGVGGWKDEDLAKYLKTGEAPGRGPVVGPMAQVVHESLSKLTDADIGAIVAYLKQTKPIAPYRPEPAAAFQGPRAPGESIYLDNCASCHQQDGKGLPGVVPPLAGSGIVQAKGPENVIRVVLGGLLAHGTYPAMPAVGSGMSDAQVAAVVDYVRNAWGNAAPGLAQNGDVGMLRDKISGVMALKGDPELKNDPCAAGADAVAVKPIDDPQDRIARELQRMKPQTMLETIDRLIARAKKLAPDFSQADLINALTRQYCRVLVDSGASDKPDARRRIGNFAGLVYTQLVDHDRN